MKNNSVSVENTVLAEGIIALLIGFVHIYFLRKRKAKAMMAVKVEIPSD